MKKKIWVSFKSVCIHTCMRAHIHTQTHIPFLTLTHTKEKENTHVFIILSRELTLKHFWGLISSSTACIMSNIRNMLLGKMFIDFNMLKTNYAIGSIKVVLVLMEPLMISSLHEQTINKLLLLYKHINF